MTATNNVCESTGKQRYHSEAAAKESIRHFRMRGLYPNLTGAYLCARCDGWHLTSQRMRAGVTR